MTDKTSDLEVLLPGREVVCKGETIVVKPLFFGQYPKAIKMVRPLATTVQQSGAFGVSPKTNADGSVSMGLTLSDGWVGALPLIMEQGGEALIQFFAFCIGKPREWFDTVPGDEGFALAHAILQENQDFFVRKILPMLETLGWTKMVSTVKDGGTSLPSSTALDTAGTTSS